MITKYTNGRSWVRNAASNDWKFHLEPYSRPSEKTLPEVWDDMRLKLALRRAVRRESAPQYLINSIRNMVRE